MKKTTLAIALATAVGAGTAQAGLIVMMPFSMSTDSANFTMMQGDGGTMGGTNDVNMLWDGTAFNNNANYTGPGSVANITVSSTTLFKSRLWSAHDIQAFATGTYTFDTALGGGNPETGNMNLVVGAGQVGIHMLFDWGSNLNIDIVVLGAINSVFGSGNGRLVNPGVIPFVQDGACADRTGSVAVAYSECLWDGNAGPSSILNPDIPALVDANQVWFLASIDQPGGDGISGTPMAAGGPFAGFNANFNINLQPVAAVPVPAAVWLFGSGLLGLIGVARRRIQT